MEREGVAVRTLIKRLKIFTICLYKKCNFCKWYSLDSNRLANLASGVLFVSSNLSKILGNEPTLRWMPSGMSVMLTFESKTVFAATGSRNILNSAYLLE